MNVQESTQYKLLEQFVKNHKEKPEECPLCLDEFNLTINPQGDEDNLQNIAITKCSHVFHKTCIKDIDVCPNCRREGIKATIEDSSKTGHIILRELLKPQNERKRKADQIENTTPSHKASNAEIVRYLFENDLLKSDAVLLPKKEASELLHAHPIFSYTVRWSTKYNEPFATSRLRSGCFDESIKDRGGIERVLSSNDNLVIPKKYIEAYNAHQAKKRKTLGQGENNSTTSKATDFETIKFHLEVPREFALTMSDKEVSEILDSVPAGTKIFFITETNNIPMVGEKTNTEIGPIVKRSFLTEHLQHTSLKEYVENNNVIIPKKYRDDYQRATFHLQKQTHTTNSKEQSKSDEELAKELALQYAELDNKHDEDEKLAKELEATGLSAEQLAQLKADEEFAKKIASEQ